MHHLADLAYAYLPSSEKSWKYCWLYCYNGNVSPLEFGHMVGVAAGFPVAQCVAEILYSEAMRY